MFIWRSLQVKKFLNLKSHYMLKRKLQEDAKLKFANNLHLRFASHGDKFPEKKPLLTNLIFGVLDEEVLQFPNTQTADRFKDFFNWLKPIENYLVSCTDTNKKLDKKEVLTNLRNLEVFRAFIDEKHNGFELSETESLKLIETLSVLPWLGTYIVNNYMLPTQVISKYGSEQQKQEYLPKIMNGEISPTICLKEGDNGTNINNIKSEIVSHGGDSYLLNGEKSFVINGINSNLFLVFARDLTSTLYSTSYSLLLVELNNKNISFSKIHDTINHHDVPMCTVNFKDIVIPKKNIIGQPKSAINIMMELLTPGRQNLAGQAICILRNFMNRLISDVIETRHFDQNLYEFGAVKRMLGEIEFHLYTMESLAYFTSGMADRYENQDVQFEKIITEKYCTNKCLNCIQAGLQLLGTQSYLKDNSYIQAFYDALALTTIHTNNLDANVYVGAHIFKSAGKLLKDHVHKRRNSQQYPFYNFKNYFLDLWFNKELNIKNSIHPSFKFVGESLEVSIEKLHKSIIRLLEYYGSTITEQQTEMIRITDMLTEIYASIVNASRASRSYSVGLRNSDIEKNIVIITVINGENKINTLANEIDQGDLLNGDLIHKKITDLTYTQHEYPLEHPLSRTF